jgi:hypothetical protein
MRKIEFAHEILSESRRSTQIYLESGRDFDKVKANMYSVFECYAHGLISWNQVRSRWHSSILEYLNLYSDRPDLYLSESNRMLGEYETTLQTHKPALDEYKRVNEQKMISNIVIKGKLNESQAKEHSNVYFNRRALNESELKDTATMKTWKRVQESYPNLTSKDELRIRMLTVFEGSTVDTTKLVTTYMSEEPTAISGPMQTSLRPKPRPTNLGNVDSASIDSAVQQALSQGTAPTTSPRPMPRPAGQSIGAGSQVAYMDNGAVDGSTRGIDPADAYSPEDLARLTGQPASSLAPKTSPRPMPRPTTLKQSANNNIRKEAAAIFNKIKVAANEGYKVLPPMDKERYTEIPGLEGPFTTLSGKVVYYDPKEGAYYDRDTDMYLSNDEYTALNSDYSGMQDERDIKVREADMPLARPNYMDTKNNPEILSAFEKQRQNWLKTNPRGGPSGVDGLNDLINFGNKIPEPLKAVDTRPVKSTLTKQSMDYFKNNPGRGLGEADLDEKAKWRSSSAAKKITDPDKDLGMADYDYHHENPRSTGRLQSIADTEPSDGSINNRQKSKINSKGDRKGKISKADINRVKSNAFNTLNKEEVELDEADFKQRQSVNGLKKMIDDHDARARNTTSLLKKDHHRKMSQQLRDQLADMTKETEVDENDTADKTWEVSYDHGPHQSNTIRVKANSQSHAWEVAKEVAKKEYGHDRITSGSVTQVKEEVEPLAELSPELLGRYASRATKDASANIKKIAGAKDRYTGRTFQGRANKREKGADMAIDKIRGNYNAKVHAKEKVDEADSIDDFAINTFEIIGEIDDDELYAAADQVDGGIEWDEGNIYTFISDYDDDFDEFLHIVGLDKVRSLNEAPLLGPQGKIHRAASADQSDREYASQKSFKDAWTAKNVGKKWPGYSEAGYKHPAYKKEESAVTEAVTLDYSRYMRAHGKKPRDAGMGSSTWMFTTAEFGNPSEDEIFQFQGSFADAKKAAAKWAKSQGEYRFYVME